MSEPSTSQRRRLRIGPLLRVVLPPLFTLILVVLLVFTMFFTDFDWQWVTFLAGILFSSVLALVSSTLKSGWRTARRAAEAVHFKQRLGAEIQQHHATREQLERELGLHQQDRARLAKETEARELAAKGMARAENLLGLLALHLDAIAFYVDRDRRCRFHTRKFATWAGVPSARIDGLAVAEVLSARDAEALRPRLLDALDGRAGLAEILLTQRDGSERQALVECLPQRDAAGAVSGVLVQIRQPQAAGAAEEAATQLIVADQSGNAVYLNSLTEELAGWGDPLERIRQAIEQGGFDLYAQDIVALRADAPVKILHELLIRMHDEEQNLVPPGTFLPIAERFGLMPEIDRLVVRKALAARAGALLSKAGAADLPALCINLARATLEDRSFAEFVARALEQSGVSGKALCFEIADSDAIACLAETTRLANELKPLGCRFSLDGFGRLGVGFSHVKALPLDFLKIDGRIILQILRVPEALAKVRAIQRVCAVIGIQTIAEMVESDEVRERLRAVEIDFVQGFGIGQLRPFS